MGIDVVGDGDAKSLGLTWKLERRRIVGIAARRRNRGARIQILISRKHIQFRVGIALSDRGDGKHNHCDQRCHAGH